MRTSRLRLAAGPLHLLLWPLLRPEISASPALACTWLPSLSRYSASPSRIRFRISTFGYVLAWKEAPGASTSWLRTRKDAKPSKKSMSQTRRCSCWPLRRAGITASSFANRPGSTISRWRKVSRSTCNYMVHAPTCSRFTAPSMPSHRNSKSRLSPAVTAHLFVTKRCYPRPPERPAAAASRLRH